MISINKAGIHLVCKTFLFPGGEVGVQIDTNNYAYKWTKAETQTITCRIKSGNDFMELVMAVDALRRWDQTPINLFLPYFPYARQDRVCNDGESLSVKAFANLINSLGFNKVTIVDPHSNACEIAIDRLRAIPQHSIVSQFNELSNRISKGVTLVSPDAGSKKKTEMIAEYFGHVRILKADKTRELSTGNITGFSVSWNESMYYPDVVIVDDICDGGKTFTELAKELKRQGVKNVILYVTNGIFSKGTKVLFDSGIDEIYTTNSYHDVFPGNVEERVVCFDLNPLFYFDKQ